MSSVVAKMNAFSLMLRRSKSSPNDAFCFLMGPVSLKPKNRCWYGGRCRLRQQRAPRIEDFLVVLAEGLAAELVGAGLGENLDASEAGPVVLRRKRIGVDAHFADG